MDSNRWHRTTAVALFILGAWGVCPAAGQGRDAPERPFRGLFGSGDSTRRGGQAITLTASAHQAYDDNLVSDAAGLDPRYQVTGPFTVVSGGLDYSRQTRRGSFTVGGQSAWGYYPDLADRTTANYSVGTGFGVQLTRRTRVRASQSVHRAPYYFVTLFPDLPTFTVPDVDLALPSFDYSVLSRTLTTYQTSAGLGRVLGRRTSLSVDYVFQASDSAGSDDRLRDQRIGARYAWQLRESLSLNLGYGYRYGRLEGAEGSRLTRSHDLDVGLGYSHTLAVSRRTQLSFGSGSALVSDGAGPVGDGSGNLHYYLTGHASLNHEFGRGWTAQATYQRGLRFIQEFDRAFFGDAASGGLDGYLGRRVRTTMLVAYSTGSPIQQAGEAFDSYRASANLQVALTRYTALEAQYIFYHYDFSRELGLPGGFVSTLDRHGVRVGLTTWLPLIR